MLPRDVYSWVGAFAVGSLVLVGLLFVGLVIQHAIGMEVVRHVERRQRALMPLVLRAIVDVAAIPELQQSLRAFDLRIVRDMLMRLAMDLREEDAANIAYLFDRLGLLESEIRCLYALRSRVRRRAAANLGLLRPAAAVPPLLELLGDRQVNVRLAAIDALGDIGCDQGLMPLIPLLEDPEPAVAWRAQEALCRSGRDVGIEVVRYLERTRNVHGSKAAVESLRWLHPRKAESRLRTIGLARRSRLRAQTAGALAAIGTETCETLLQALLYDPSPLVRAHAAKALGQMGRDLSVPALRAALVDESWEVRLEAARALVGMREPGITALLEEMAEIRREDRVVWTAEAEGTEPRAQVA